MNYEQKLKNQWNAVYDNFDGSRLSVWRENASPFLSNKIEYLKHLKIKKVLDAGCGDGRNLVEFAKSGFEITGVDVSESALKRCGENTKEFQNVSLEKSLLESLPFEPESFDLVYCDFVLTHMENVEKVLENFHRVLKKGGLTLLEFTSPKDHSFGQGKQIGEREFLQNGVYLRYFTIPEVESLLKNFKILGIDTCYYTDPFHGPGYHRKDRHVHHSHLVLAEKKA